MRHGTWEWYFVYLVVVVIWSHRVSTSTWNALVVKWRRPKNIPSRRNCWYTLNLMPPSQGRFAFFWNTCCFWLPVVSWLKKVTAGIVFSEDFEFVDRKTGGYHKTRCSVAETNYHRKLWFERSFWSCLKTRYFNFAVWWSEVLILRWVLAQILRCQTKVTLSLLIGGGG